MGLTVLEVEIGNPANPDFTERLDLLVDSGAVYSVVPAAALGRLGIRALREKEFLLGALTLEALGFVLDPLRRELRSLPMILSTGS